MLHVSVLSILQKPAEIICVMTGHVQAALEEFLLEICQAGSVVAKLMIAVVVVTRFLMVTLSVP